MDVDFLELERRFGKFDFDAFASDENFRVPFFSSLLFSEKAAFRDAFSRNWRGLGFVYAHPPPHLAGEVAKKAALDLAEGVLVIPHWLTLKQWHLICEDGIHVNKLFGEIFKFFPKYKKGPFVRSPVFCGYPKFASLALRFNGNVRKPFESFVHPSHCTLGSCNKCC